MTDTPADVPAIVHAMRIEFDHLGATYATLGLKIARLEAIVREQEHEAQSKAADPDPLAGEARDPMQEPSP